MTPALVLSALSGFIALSYEILWFRVFSFVSGGSAKSFPLLLGFYLLGVALGSLGARRLCRFGSRAEDAIPALVLAANVAGFFVSPLAAWLVSKGVHWTMALPLVEVAATALGAIFPVIAHVSVPPNDRSGARVSYLYVANIAGCTAGSLGTGLLFLDHFPLPQVSLGLLCGGFIVAILTLRFVDPERRARSTWTLRGVAVAVVLLLMSVPVYGGLYERLQYRENYRDGMRFVRVVETRSGVVTVDAEGRLFGGGIYDGAFNTGLEPDANSIWRAYAFAELHRAPKDLLLIGLSSGSWASVLANHPGVERLTIVEINPGYLRLLPEYADVAGLLSNPKVRVEIDDGRRWLVRNPDARFDGIVANTTFHWRSGASNLLSTEFLELVRSRLKPGGVYYHNTTGSDRVKKTGALTFRHSLAVDHFLALSDTPIAFDGVRWKETLRTYPRNGRPLFDAGRDDDRRRLDEIATTAAARLEPGVRILARTQGIPPVTDDNMGTEWSESP